MARPGAGKRQMAAQRKKQWNSTVRSLKKTGSALRGSRRKKQGCYIATCVYGSYDCPEVWTLRRFRDDTLENSWFGRRFISIYNSISPTLVRLFGKNRIITNQWKVILDAAVKSLTKKGVSSDPYTDTM